MLIHIYFYFFGLTIVLKNTGKFNYYILILTIHTEDLKI